MLTYALIISKKSKRELVFKRIQEVAEKKIENLDRVNGEFDILASFKMPNDKRMNELLNQIKMMEGVVTLKTFTVVHKTKEYDSIPKFVVNN